MASPIQRALAAGGFASILSLTLACGHMAVNNSVPTTTPTPAQLASIRLTGASTFGWRRARTVPALVA
jgi:hypothetical protein